MGATVRLRAPAPLALLRGRYRYRLLLKAPLAARRAACVAAGPMVGIRGVGPGLFPAPWFVGKFFVFNALSFIGG